MNPWRDVIMLGVNQRAATTCLAPITTATAFSTRPPFAPAFPAPHYV